MRKPSHHSYPTAENALKSEGTLRETRRKEPPVGAARARGCFRRNRICGPHGLTTRGDEILAPPTCAPGSWSGPWRARTLPRRGGTSDPQARVRVNQPSWVGVLPGPRRSFDGQGCRLSQMKGAHSSPGVGSPRPSNTLRAESARPGAREPTCAPVLQERRARENRTCARWLSPSACARDLAR